MSRPKPAETRTGHASQTVEIKRSAPLATLPLAPQTLGVFGAGVWDELWVLGNGVYAPTDVHILERYCSLIDRRHNLLEIVESEGWMSKGSTGQSVVHPAARMVGDIEGKLSALEDRLGLNPESRMRLGITAVEHQNKLEAFLGGNK